MEDSVSIVETKDNASITEPKGKVSIAVAKEKVSNAAAKGGKAAAKGGKALMTLVHKAKHSSKEPEPTGSLSEHQPNPEISTDDTDSDSDEPTTNSPKGSMEGKAKLVSDEPTPNSPKSSMERKAKLVNKLKRSLKVGKKSTDADNRSQLLDGNPDDPSPRVRSADSIKIAYGHKPSTDPTSIAAMNREKLVERQEKLQALKNESEEMLEGAADFASMAEELAKRIENKKWYQL